MSYFKKKLENFGMYQVKYLSFSIQKLPTKEGNNLFVSFIEHHLEFSKSGHRTTQMIQFVTDIYRDTLEECVVDTLKSVQLIYDCDFVDRLFVYDENWDEVARMSIDDIIYMSKKA